MADLKAITVYLPPEEIDALNREAEEEGRSGASAQIRWVLARRRAAPTFRVNASGVAPLPRNE